MTAARLPQVGGDDGNWGAILNDYLAQAHASNGILKANAVGSEQIADEAITSTKIAVGAVGTAQLADSIDPAKIAGTALTLVDIAQSGTGVAGLDDDGDVTDASGAKIINWPGQISTSGPPQLALSPEGSYIGSRPQTSQTEHSPVGLAIVWRWVRVV